MTNVYGRGGQHPEVWVLMKSPKGLAIEGSSVIKKKKMEYQKVPYLQGYCTTVFIFFQYYPHIKFSESVITSISHAQRMTTNIVNVQQLFPYKIDDKMISYTKYILISHPKKKGCRILKLNYITKATKQ